MVCSRLFVSGDKHTLCLGIGSLEVHSVTSIILLYIFCSRASWSSVNLEDAVFFSLPGYSRPWCRIDENRHHRGAVPARREMLHVSLTTLRRQWRDFGSWSVPRPSETAAEHSSWARRTICHGAAAGDCVASVQPKSNISLARDQPILPSGEQISKLSVFLQFHDREIKTPVGKAVPESTKKSTCFASCVVLFCFAPLFSLWEEIFVKGNEDNKLHFASGICTVSCHWTLSVPGSSQFALGQLSASRNR